MGNILAQREGGSTFLHTKTRTATATTINICTSSSIATPQFSTRKILNLPHVRCFSESSSSSSPSDSSSSSSSASFDDRPFRILGVQQIAVGSTDRDALLHLWHNLLGLPLLHPTPVRLAAENVLEDSVRVGVTKKSQVTIDLMTPIDVQALPRVHTPPLHHIGLWVSDLPAAVAWMSTVHRVRFTPGGIRRGAAGHDICFVHPKGNDEFPVCGNGVLIELVQAPPDVIAAAEAGQNIKNE